MIRPFEVFVDELLTPTSGFIFTEQKFWDFLSMVPERAQLDEMMELNPEMAVYGHFFFDCWFVMKVNRSESSFLVFIQHRSLPIDNVAQMMAIDQSYIEQFETIRLEFADRFTGPFTVQLVVT